MEDELSVASLPDQLPIIAQSSTHTEEEPLKAIPPKFLPKKRKSTKLQTILHPKHSIKRRYFTSGVNVNVKNARNFKNEQSPFECPKDIEEFAHKVLTKAWRNDVRVKELEKKVFDRPSYKDRQKKDLLNRLYVKEPKLLEGKAVLDIDPNYFSAVEGRPIIDRLDIREYIKIVRETLRTKIVTGYREDDIMLIDETMKLEQKMIDTIKENLQDYINVFEEFLIIDHRTAMQLLQEAEATSTISYGKYVEYNEVVKKYASLRSSLYNLEEKWKQCKSYQKFLYAVSPVTWRMEQEPQKRRTSIYMMAQTSDDMLGIFGNIRLSLVQRGFSLEDIIQEFRHEISDDRPPQLYFTEPEQLLEVYKFIEMQNLNSLLYAEELALPLANIKGCMRMAEVIFDKEIKQLEEIIDKLELGISWEEQRVIYLEELGEGMIDTELKCILMDENVLNLHVFVEDIYEDHLGPNDANLSIWQMMKAVEEKYRHELLLLDMVPSEQVAQLEGNYYKEEMQVMKLAERAAKQFAELERITVSLKKSFSPPPKKDRRELKRRSPPIKHPLKVEEPPRDLTRQEKEFLELFTDFCEYIDDPRDFGFKPNPEVDAALEAKKVQSKGTKLLPDEVHRP